MANFLGFPSCITNTDYKYARMPVILSFKKLRRITIKLNISISNGVHYT